MDNDEKKETTSPIIVICDVCGTENECPKSSWHVRCKNDAGPCKGRLLLPPLEDNKKYIQIICGGAVATTRVQATDTTLTCNCRRECEITDIVAEIRCNQVVYKTEQKVNILEELNKVKEERDLEKKNRSELHQKVEEMSKELETLKNQKKEDDVTDSRIQLRQFVRQELCEMLLKPLLLALILLAMAVLLKVVDDATVGWGRFGFGWQQYIILIENPNFVENV